MPVHMPPSIMYNAGVDLFAVPCTSDLLVNMMFYCGRWQPTTSKRPAVVPGALVKVPTDNIYIFIVRITDKLPDGNISSKSRRRRHNSRSKNAI